MKINFIKINGYNLYLDIIYQFLTVIATKKIGKDTSLTNFASDKNKSIPIYFILLSLNLPENHILFYDFKKNRIQPSSYIFRGENRTKLGNDHL